MNVAAPAPPDDPGPPRPTLAEWLDAIEEGMDVGADLALRRDRARAIYDGLRPLICRLLEGPTS